MSLGRAFIEVHADLKPFKKSLGKDITDIVKDTQKSVEKAVSEAAGKANKGSRSRAGGINLKAKLDTSDADREGKGLFRRLSGYAGKAFDKVGDSIAFSIQHSDQLRTAGIIVGVIVAAAAAPLIGAAIAGAIAAAVGVAGIGAGIALAFQDARIQSAAKAAFAKIMDGLKNAAGVFVQPTLRAIDLLFNAFNRQIPRVERIFSNLAPYVDDLATGIAGFMDAIGPGLESAFANSGPFIQIVAEYLPVIGDALGYMFQQLSASEGARAGLVVFFQMLGDLIVFTTDALTTLSSIFAGFIRWIDMLPDAVVPDGIQQDVDEMINAMDAGKDPIWRFAGGLNEVKTSATGAKSATTDLTASLNTFFGAALSSSNANIAFEESLDNVRDTLKENGKHFDINTAKGRANVSMVNNSIQAAITARDATIKHTGSVAAGNAVYATQIERLRGVLHKAGLTETQIRDLIGAYDDLPPEVNTEVHAPGLSSALSQAEALNRELQSIHSERVRSRQNPTGKDQGVGGHAEGGIIRREQLSWVGEGNRPEAIIPLTNPRRAAEVMNEAGLSGMGGGTIVVQLVMDGKVIEEKVVNVNQAQARQIRNQPRKVI